MEKEVYNIAVAPNNPYVKYAAVLMQSLFETNSDKMFHFFVIYNNLEKSKMEELQEYVEKYGSIIDFIYVDEKKYETFPTQKRFPIEAYFRLEVQDILPKEIERLLYLDCDMMICGDIAELYYTDFEDRYLVACGFSVRCECGNEFNSGMLLINMEKMRQDITFETYRKLVDQLHGDFYLDQGLLNYQFAENGTKYVWKEKYNFTCPFYRKYENQIQSVLPGFSIDDVVVMHFAGPGLRPWEAQIDDEEYKRLNKKNLLDIFAANGCIIDELYIHFLSKWWEYAKKVPMYQELLFEMYRKKCEIYTTVLGRVIDTKEYHIGYKIMKNIRKIKKNR